jgi:hypothetical protein
MNRQKRVRRIADATERSERAARAGVAVAARDLTTAQVSLEEIWDQCRSVAVSDTDLPLKFGRALVETGWLVAEERAAAVRGAEARLAERTTTWSTQKTRLDALERLIGRLDDVDRSERARRDRNALDDLVTSRTIHAAHEGSMP